MKNQKTIKELKEKGYFVEVYHGRVHTLNGYDIKHGNFEIMSRREAKLNGLTDTHTVFCKGGFTYLRLVTPDGVEVTGKCNFSNNRHFNRKLGLNIAIGRALAKLEK